MPDPAAAFDAGIVARGAAAVLALLEGNAKLVAYFATGDNIYATETELLAFDAGSLKAPGLGVAIGPESERAIGNANCGELAFAIDMLLYTSVDDRRTTNNWLRARVVNEIKATVAANAGELYDALGVQITEARWEFDRLDFRGRLRGTSVLLTPLRLTLYADFNRVTREVL